MAGNETAALVVALSAQLTKFEKDMQRAGEIADKGASDIEGRFNKINPTFAGSFLGSFLSNLPTKALDAAIKLVEDLKNRFIDLEATAQLVGTTLNEAFGFQEAAAKAKVPIEDVNKSMRALATLLDQMQRGDTNSLTKLFDANPAALQGVNREALNLQQTFKIVADLVQNADTNIQKIDISQAAGQTETMVKFLQQGGAAVTRLSNDAAAAAPDLQKLADGAKAFDDAWQSAVKNIKASASEHIFDVFKQDLTDIVALLGLAGKFLSLFKAGPLEGLANDASKQIAKMEAATQSLLTAKSQVDESAGLNTNGDARSDRRGGSGRTGGGTSTRDENRPITNIPPKDTVAAGDNKLDTASDRIEKHTALLKADAEAVGLGAGKLEEYRAKQVLLTAAEQAGIPVTGAIAAEIDRVAKAAGAAGEALAKAKIASEIKFGAGSAFLSQGDVQIAQQLRDIYGNDIPAALESSAASALRFNSANRDISNIISTNLTTALADVVSGTKSAADAFKDFGKVVIRAIEEAIVKLLIVGPLMRGLQSGLGGIFGGVGGAGAAATGTPGVSGVYADGTDYAAGGLSLVGERGPELVKIPRGAQVIPNDVLRSGGGGGMSMTFAPQIDARGASVEAVARLEGIVARQSAEFESRAIATYRKARSGRVI